MSSHLIKQETWINLAVEYCSEKHWTQWFLKHIWNILWIHAIQTSDSLIFYQQRPKCNRHYVDSLTQCNLGLTPTMSRNSVYLFDVSFHSKGNTKSITFAWQCKTLGHSEPVLKSVTSCCGTHYLAYTV